MNISHRKSPVHVALTIVIIMLLLGLTACGSNESRTNPGGAKARTSIQFSWVDTIEFSGFYMAQERGYYAQENLDVRLDTGGFDANGNYIDPVQRVIDGQADFGVFSADGLIRARANGQPVVAIAAIYQRNPVALVSLLKSNLRTPRDLTGKRIGVNVGSDDHIFAALLTAQGIALTDVITVEADPSLDALMTGRIDAQMGFITNEPIALRAAGYEPAIILPGDYGIEFYANVIFTTDNLIAQQPDKIERFLRATLQGYKAAMADPKQAAELAVKRNAAKFETEFSSMQASLPLLKPTGSELGMMTTQMWNRAHQILVEQKLLDKPINVNEVYTMAFLNKIYNK